MSKINLTHKTTADQVRILRDYIQRRTQHKNQEQVTLEQVIKRFKHKQLVNDRQKAAYFRKLLNMALKEEALDKVKPAPNG